MVILSAAAVTVLTASCSGGEAPAPRPVEEILQQALTESGLPGIGAVVTNGDGILELAVAGVRRADTAVPLETDDPFHIGSVSKPLTATVIARLVEAGTMRWDMPVAEVLPEVMQSALPVFDGVTLTHLLAHEAGLKPMEEDEELADVPPLTGDVTAQRRQFAHWVFKQQPTVTPLSEYRYSNAHFVVAAAMAEALSGEAWEALIEKHIFEQFDMRRSGFGWAGKGGENVPWGHWYRDGSLHPVDPNGDYQLPQYLAPAGDIHASLPDMARFFQGILLSWQEKGRYLGRDTLQHMLTRRLRSGLGWGVREAFGYDRVATYSGSADTFLMVVVLIPDADLGFAVAANAYSEDIERAVVQALRSIVRLYVTDKDQQ